MPLRRYNRRSTRSRRPAARKPTMAKAKRMVTKERKVKAKRNMDTFFLRAKWSAVITPQQGGTVANYVYFNPSLVNATDVLSVTANAEFNLYKAQYDKVRINSMTVIVRPRGNVLDQVLAQDDAKINGTGNNTVMSCVDRDGKVPTNLGRIIRYPSVRKHTALQTFKRTYSVRYPTGVWLDCQNIFEDQTLINRLGLNGSICVYGENLIEDNLEIFNEPWADVELYYDCVFQGKVGSAISQDASGNIVVTADTQTPTYADETVEALIGGFTNYRFDMSGNLVPFKDNDSP